MAQADNTFNEDPTLAKDQRRINIDNLERDPFQSRSASDNITDEAFTELRESIADMGLLNEIIVRPISMSDVETNYQGDYFIVSGERRVQAMVEKGIIDIPCKVVEMDDEEAVQTSLTENTVRKQLSGKEMAIAIRRWYDLLSHDLLGEDEPVECPDCHWSGNGRKSFETHVNQSHGGLVNLTKPPCQYLSRGDIYRHIARKLLADEGKWQTIERVVKVARLPGDALSLLEHDERRSSTDEKSLKEWGVTKTEKFDSYGPPKPFRDLASLNEELLKVDADTFQEDATRGTKLLKAYASDRDITDIKNTFSDWRGLVPADDAFQFALDGRGIEGDDGGLDPAAMPESRADLEEYEHAELRALASISDDVSGNATSAEIIDGVVDWLDLEEAEEDESDESEEEQEDEGNESEEGDEEEEEEEEEEEDDEAQGGKDEDDEEQDGEKEDETPGSVEEDDAQDTVDKEDEPDDVSSDNDEEADDEDDDEVGEVDDEGDEDGEIDEEVEAEEEDEEDETSGSVDPEPTSKTEPEPESEPDPEPSSESASEESQEEEQEQADVSVEVCFSATGSKDEVDNLVEDLEGWISEYDVAVDDIEVKQ